MHGGIVDFIYLLIDPSKNQPFMDWSICTVAWNFSGRINSKFECDVTYEQ